MATAFNLEKHGGSKNSREKFLTFQLGNESYGLEILKVRDIIGVKDLTPIPHAPEYIKGVMNLRGKIIPVMELRRKFNLPSVEDTKRTCIIVVQVDHLEMGLKVDSVYDVIDLSDEAREPAPDFGAQVEIKFILGMGKTENGVCILLDIKNILDTQDIIRMSNLETSTLSESGGKEE